MSSENSSVEMAAVKEEDEEVKAEQQSSAAAAAMKMKNRKMVRLDDRYVRRLQRLPDPIKSLTVSESLLHAFPNLREVLRHADAQVKALIEIEADISRQFREKGFAELDEALLSPALLN